MKRKDIFIILFISVFLIMSGCAKSGAGGPGMTDENIKYYMISSFEHHPEWTYTFSQGKNLSVVQAYFSDSAKTQPVLIIYKLR